MKKVWLLTEDRFLQNPKNDWYIQQILDDDKALQKALIALGVHSERVSWSDWQREWSQADAAIIRTTWDYFERFAEFQSWLDHCNDRCEVINTRDLVLWNLDKSYLKDLEQAGITIVPSFFIPQGDSRALAESIDYFENDDFIIKPCVSAGAYETHRFHQSEWEDRYASFKRLIDEMDMMVQPFQNSVIKKGEISLILIGGQYSHAVLKKAKSGDFRVQDDFGGSVEPYHPNQTEIDFALSVLAACPELPTYARVDLLWGDQNQLLLTELEIVEPELWLRHSPKACRLFAHAIDAQIKQT